MTITYTRGSEFFSTTVDASVAHLTARRLEKSGAQITAFRNGGVR